MIVNVNKLMFSFKKTKSRVVDSPASNIIHKYELFVKIKRNTISLRIVEHDEPS